MLVDGGRVGGGSGRSGYDKHRLWYNYAIKEVVV